MNTLYIILFGILGIVFGFKIVDISYKIMEYKRKDTNNIKGVRFLDSNYMKIILCLFNGVTCIISVIRVENIFAACLISILITIGIIIAYIDLKIRIIPNEIVLTLIIVGILLQTIYFGPKALISAFVSMIVMMVVFTSVAGFVGFGKVGAGDVKLAGAMGLTLGYPLIITAIGIMAVVLLVFILIGMAIKKIFLSTMLPMAPFMISGFIFALFTLLI